MTKPVEHMCQHGTTCIPTVFDSFDGDKPDTLNAQAWVLVRGLAKLGCSEVVRYDDDDDPGGCGACMVCRAEALIARRQRVLRAGGAKPRRQRDPG